MPQEKRQNGTGHKRIPQMKRGTIWDPLRKREVALTPEEEVRQRFISLLMS